MVNISTILCTCLLVIPLSAFIAYMLFDVLFGDEYCFTKRCLAKTNSADWPRLSCAEAINLLQTKGIEYELNGDKEEGWYHSVDIYTKSGNYLSSFSFTSVFEAMKFNRRAKRILSKNKNLQNKMNMYNKIKEELNK